MTQRILLLLFSFLIPACSYQPDPVPFENPVSGGENSVHVVSHGWHTGFVIDADVAEPMMPFLRGRFASARAYEFGWGDQGFYQADEVTTGITLRAILRPTPSVMHVVALDREPGDFFANSEMTILELNDAELHGLVEFIGSSFLYSEDGDARMLDEGRYGDSQFYRAIGEYHLFNTCNVWTAKGLQSAGYDISSWFRLTAGSVIEVDADDRLSVQ